MYAATRTRADWAVALVGVALAAVAVSTWRTEAGVAAPAVLTLVTASTPDLAVDPAGTTAERAHLTPGSRSDGLERSLSVRNATGEALVAFLRARPASGSLDGEVRIVVRVGDEERYEGTLGGLRGGTAIAALASHASTDVDVSAWIPARGSGGWSARADTVELVWTTEAAR